MKKRKGEKGRGKKRKWRELEREGEGIKGKR